MQLKMSLVFIAIFLFFALTHFSDSVSVILSIIGAVLVIGLHDVQAAIVAASQKNKEVEKDG